MRPTRSSCSRGQASSSSSTVSLALCSTPHVPVHPSQSFADYRVGVDTPGEYRVILDSDEKRFGGDERIQKDGRYFTTPMGWNGRRNWLQVRVLVPGSSAPTVRSTFLVGQSLFWDFEPDLRKPFLFVTMIMPLRVRLEKSVDVAL